MPQGHAKRFIWGSVAGLRRLVRCSVKCLRKTQQYSVAYSHTGGAFDALYTERAGLIRLEGWTTSERIQDVTFPKCFLNGKEVQLFEAFRTYRPDIAAVRGTDNLFLGLVISYKLQEEMCGALAHLKLTYDSAMIFEVSDAFFTENAPYSHLLDAAEVQHRENIYGYGPPNTAVVDEIKGLGKMVLGPVLDFGCGSGVLIRALRAHDIEAYGIEINRPPIVESIHPDVRTFIKLYNGSYPLPFSDEEFQSVIATEVIEHVPEYEKALSEITRITKSTFVLTVPDMSAIPVCHHNNVVPWHLLESTHVNFFTQTSLERVLSQYFSDIQFARIGPTVTNGSKWFTSLVGICRK
jgi:2-polyprenyl-3-methyl-5-hydroxy-6-metoxy-1,4-benzoquinol methylase